MTINTAETPLAAPLHYSDAAQRLRPPTRPQPLGGDFARGVTQPAVKVELSDLAKEMQRANNERLSTLEAESKAARIKNVREVPFNSQDRLDAPKGVQSQQVQAETDADRVSRNKKAEPPPINMEPKQSLLVDAGPSLRKKLELQDTNSGLTQPLQPPVTETAPPPRPPVQLERAPRLLSSGVTPGYAMQAYQRAAG